MKWKAWAAILSATTFTAFAGAVAGTLAWYAYATRASASLNGTSVYSTEQLQMGLRTEKDISLVGDFSSSYKLSSDSDGVKTYKLEDEAKSNFVEVVETSAYRYWFIESGTGLSVDDIQPYLEKKSINPYYTNTLVPVTTGDYKYGDDFYLYRNPRKAEDTKTKADPDSYKTIDFAFRVTDSSGRYIKNQGIWLANAKESVSGSASSSLRLYFEGDSRKDDGSLETKKILFNPTSRKDGSTMTAGLLDLDADGYYDYDTDYMDGGKEHIYGLFNNQPSSDKRSKFDEDVSGKGSDINSFYSDGETDYENNTFYASHKKGIDGYQSYEGIDMPYSQYYGQESVYPLDQNGALSKGEVLTMTSDDSLSIANLSMTIYLEGWDHSVIDKNIDFTFQLGLTFQINKVAKGYEA